MYTRYAYAGRNDTSLLDDIWVLSLPQFHWTKVTKRSDRFSSHGLTFGIQIFEGTAPRYGHTCHLIEPRQMLTVGGWSDDDTNRTNDCDWESRGVAIYEMSTLTWGSVYSAELPAYEVPQLVVDEIGGR